MRYLFSFFTGDVFFEIKKSIWQNRELYHYRNLVLNTYLCIKRALDYLDLRNTNKNLTKSFSVELYSIGIVCEGLGRTNLINNQIINFEVKGRFLLIPNNNVGLMKYQQGFFKLFQVLRKTGSWIFFKIRGLCLNLVRLIWSKTLKRYQV